jgi:pimeloyl-ACP methyl ester carboxylesterase
MPMLTVNGAELYHEVRGDGPAVLFIIGMTGDAGHVESLAGVLADEFTVVGYDRRENGRSPRPAPQRVQRSSVRAGASHPVVPTRGQRSHGAAGAHRTLLLGTGRIDGAGLVLAGGVGVLLARRRRRRSAAAQRPGEGCGCR